VTPARSSRAAKRSALSALLAAFYALVQGEAISSEAACQRLRLAQVLVSFSMGPDRVEEAFPLADQARMLRR